MGAFVPLGLDPSDHSLINYYGMRVPAFVVSPWVPTGSGCITHADDAVRTDRKECSEVGRVRMHGKLCSPGEFGERGMRAFMRIAPGHLKILRYTSLQESVRVKE